MLYFVEAEKNLLIFRQSENVIEMTVEWIFCVDFLTFLRNAKEISLEKPKIDRKIDKYGGKKHWNAHGAFQCSE